MSQVNVGKFKALALSDEDKKEKKKFGDFEFELKVKPDYQDFNIIRNTLVGHQNFDKYDFIYQDTMMDFLTLKLFTNITLPKGKDKNSGDMIFDEHIVAQIAVESGLMEFIYDELNKNEFYENQMMNIKKEIDRYLSKNSFDKLMDAMAKNITDDKVSRIMDWLDDVSKDENKQEQLKKLIGMNEGIRKKLQGK